MSGPAWAARGRYLAVVVIGFGVDLGLTLLLHRVAGVPLTVAAAIGFTAALGLNYLLFEFWALKGERARLSAERLAATVASALVALSARLAVIEALRRVIGEADLGRTTAIVLAGALVSMVVNYLLVSAGFAWSRRRERA